MILDSVVTGSKENTRAWALFPKSIQLEWN